jgi:hypothetical protein
MYVYMPTMDGYGASVCIYTYNGRIWGLADLDPDSPLQSRGGGGGGGMVDFGSNLGSEESSGKISEFAPSSSYTQKN